MKSNATLEDYKIRDAYLIRYIERQIRKLEENYSRYECEESVIKTKPYKDILFKLTKDDTKTDG